jgi:hypothetical protein
MELSSFTVGFSYGILFIVWNDYNTDSLAALICGST